MKLFTALIFSLFLAGCSTSYTSTTQLEESAYIQLSGDFWGTKLTIDNELSTQITKDSTTAFTLNGVEVVKFPIDSGTHRVTISRVDQPLIDRKIYVSDNNIFEIAIP